MLKLLLYLTLFKINIADEIVRKHVLPLCVDSTLRSYRVEDRCSTDKNVTQEIFPVQIYKPMTTLVTLSAIACQKKFFFRETALVPIF